MIVHHGLDNIRERDQRGVVTIGNFDGVHVGHRLLIGRACQEAGERGVPSVGLTFSPHPEEILRPNQPFPRLSNRQDQVRLFEDAGLSHAILLPFDEARARQSAEDFLDEVFRRTLKPSKIIVGFNFRFGHRAQGDVDLLGRFCRENAIELEIIDGFSDGPDMVSSTLIRGLLAAGELDRASRLLTRYHSISGPVEHGQKRGRQWGFPTLNLLPGKLLVPAEGVYAGLVCLENTLHPAAVYVGKRPTFDNTRVVIESFLLDFSGDAYGKAHRVHFIARIRGDMKFDQPEALVRQIEADVQAIRDTLREEPLYRIWPPCEAESTDGD